MRSIATKWEDLTLVQWFKTRLDNTHSPHSLSLCSKSEALVGLPSTWSSLTQAAWVLCCRVWLLCPCNDLLSLSLSFSL